MSQSISAEEFLKLQGGGRSKYGVAAKGERTWNGRTYDSKAEMEYAKHLACLLGWTFGEQPAVRLGADVIYRPDFVVIDGDGLTEFVDVKGAETKDFRRVKKLWAKYIRVPLRVVRRGRGGFETVEVIAHA